jgi:hypothetical protein
MYRVLLFTLIVSIAHAETFTVNGKDASKRDAIVTLAKDPNANVIKCQSVELSDKGTLKNRKK